MSGNNEIMEVEMPVKRRFRFSAKTPEGTSNYDVVRFRLGAYAAAMGHRWKIFRLGRAGWLAGAAVLVGLAAGCSSGDAAPEPVPLDFQPVDFTPREPVDFSGTGVPLSDDGRPVLIEVPGLRLEYDEERRDAITAFGACLDLLTACFDPDARSLDACFFSARRCESDAPWLEASACCPKACFDQYRAAREAGDAPFDALEATMFQEVTCVPGLQQLLREGRR